METDFRYRLVNHASTRRANQSTRGAFPQKLKAAQSYAL